MEIRLHRCRNHKAIDNSGEYDIRKGRRGGREEIRLPEIRMQNADFSPLLIRFEVDTECSLQNTTNRRLRAPPSPMTPPQPPPPPPPSSPLSTASKHISTSDSPSTSSATPSDTWNYVWIPFLISLCKHVSSAKASPESTVVLPSNSVSRLSSTCPTPDSKLNFRPIIGILSHPGDGASGRLNNATNASYIAASYVKFVESAGARVIPLIYNEPPEILQSKLNLVNGVLFTGGWAKSGLYADVVEGIFKQVLKKNNEGDQFPLLAICLGFELLTMIVSKNNKILEQFSASDQASTLQFMTNIEGTVFQRFPPDLLAKLSTDCLVMQNHKYGISPEKFQENINLCSFFKILTTSTDQDNKVYVSTVQSQRYPITAVQWHPEVFTTRENLKKWVDNVARNLGYVTYDYWTLTVKNGEHNHDPAMYMEGHAFAKRLTKDERRMVEDMTDNNVPPRDILSTLKSQNEHNTNKYNMPFLEIVGVTSTSNTFSIAFVLMDEEKEANYTWALNRLRTTLGGYDGPYVIVTDRELALMNACANSNRLDAGNTFAHAFIKANSLSVTITYGPSYPPNVVLRRFNAQPFPTAKMLPPNHSHHFLSLLQPSSPTKSSSTIPPGWCARATLGHHGRPWPPFHMKNAFEWGLSMIPHSDDAVQVTQHFANFFVSEARKSLNRPPVRKVLDNLIYNYSPTYCGKAGKGYDEVYIFVENLARI
ncbi:hypothetical protein LXL04_016646 [Taraxacum kok-saghyz]